MLLDKKRQRDIAERKRRTRYTIFQTIWLVFAIAIAAGITYWLFTNEVLTTGFFYSMDVPRAVPEWAIYFAVGFVILIVMQLLFSVGYLVGSPKGRRKTGEATVDSTSLDPAEFDEF